MIQLFQFCIYTLGLIAGAMGLLVAAHGDVLTGVFTLIVLAVLGVFAAWAEL